jgi:NNP family nitrate/nitrite transporter-like MFS transporter
VALVQLLVPLAISAGAFGLLAGPAQQTAQGPMWLQNAGFIWVPLILASTAGRLVRHGRPVRHGTQAWPSRP